MKLFSLLLLLVLTSCSSEPKREFSNLEDVKNDFIANILSESVFDDGPFEMRYHLRTVLFSEHVVSMIGEVFVYDHLPHGRIKYEGKTYVKTDGTFKEIQLNDLFPHPQQIEFLRSYCENDLKKTSNGNHFNGSEPLNEHLDQELLKVFVVDHESLILVFQPYAVGGFSDGPFIVKIPFTQLIGKWQEDNPVKKYLPIENNFLSSWDPNNWVRNDQANHSMN